MDRVSRSVRAAWVAGLMSLLVVVGASPARGASRRHVCRPPARARVLASNRKAVLYSQRGRRFYGCLKALGVPRLLLKAGSRSDFYAMIAVRLAGRFAALEPEYHVPDYRNSEDATLYDLSSGKATHLAKVSWPIGEGATSVGGLDFLALDSSGFAAWRETSRPIPDELTALSCPSASLCIAGDFAGNIVTSSDPDDGPDTWSRTGVLTSGFIEDASCPSVSMCVVGDSAGNILTSTDPTGGKSAWRKTKVASPGDDLRVSCASVTLCVASDTNGNIVTSTDPTGGASAWRSAPLSSGDTPEGVSCPSVSFCLAGTYEGDVVSSTDPMVGARAWKQTPAEPGSIIGAVSCPSVSMCIAGDNYDNVLTSTDPTGGARAWNKALLDPHGLSDVYCPSVSRCVAAYAWDIYASTDPTGGKSAWRKTHVERTGGPGLSAVSCPSVSLCVAADDAGRILISTDPTGGASAWSSPTGVPGCPQPSAPCTSEQLYAHDDQGTRVVDTAPPGHRNSIGNVALASRVLNWTHDGAQRQLQLR